GTGHDAGGQVAQLEVLGAREVDEVGEGLLVGAPTGGHHDALRLVDHGAGGQGTVQVPREAGQLVAQPHLVQGGPHGGGEHLDPFDEVGGGVRTVEVDVEGTRAPVARLGGGGADLPPRGRQPVGQPRPALVAAHVGADDGLP